MHCRVRLQCRGSTCCSEHCSALETLCVRRSAPVWTRVLTAVLLQSRLSVTDTSDGLMPLTARSRGEGGEGFMGQRITSILGSVSPPLSRCRTSAWMSVRRDVHGCCGLPRRAGLPAEPRQHLRLDLDDGDFVHALVYLIVVASLHRMHSVREDSARTTARSSSAGCSRSLCRSSHPRFPPARSSFA
jgi:hypothetical protein